MPSYTGDTVRVNFNIPKALHLRLVEQMPTGIRTRVFNKLTEMLVIASEKKGNIVFGAILDEKFRIEIDLPNPTMKVKDYPLMTPGKGYGSA